MASTTITEIEKHIDELSLDEQLRLLERLASRVGRKATEVNRNKCCDLVAMAADTDIQRELSEIREVSV